MPHTQTPFRRCAAQSDIKHNTTTIDYDTFLKYLDKEGLQQAITGFVRDKQESDQTRERFKRHAKLLVRAGEDFARDDSSLVIGYELELVPLQNPYRLQPGAKLEIQLLYRNQPLAGILVKAFAQSAPTDVQTARSDSAGRVDITLDRPGPWLINAVRIQRLQGEKAEYESHWASLTFSTGR